MLAPKVQMPIAQAGPDVEFARPFVALNLDGSAAAAGSVTYQGAIPITPGTSVEAGSAVAFFCWSPGSMIFTLADGSTIQLLLLADGGKTHILRLAVIGVLLSPGAEGQFWNLRE